MIRYFHIFFIFINISISFLLAEDIQLKGYIIDASSNQPLKGADVYLLKSLVGTVTDEEGFFTILIKQVYPDDSLVIGFLGYKTLKLLLSSFTNNTKIYLKPSSLEYGEEILIHAERESIIKQDIPHAITTIEFDEIERYGSSEIADVLKPLPAVRVEGNELDGKRIQIRGSNSDEVKVYLDGVLINNMRIDNSADLSIIPVDNIENLEIIKGGNSALLGGGAFAGIVNISTRQPTKTGGHLRAKMGSFDSGYLIGNIDLYFTKNLAVSYFGQINQYKPEIEFFPSERFTAKTRSSDILIKRQNHMATLSYITGAGQFISRVITYFNKYEKPFWKNDYQNYLTSLNYKGNIFGSRDFNVNINIFHSRTKILRSSKELLNFENIFYSNHFNINFAKKFKYKLSEIQLLAEYFHDDLTNDAKISDMNLENNLAEEYFYDNKMSTAAVFAFNDQLKQLPNLSWKTYIGIRGDAVASGYSDVSPSFGASIKYKSRSWKISPFLNYGKNVKYPTLLENAYVRDITNLSGTDSTISRLKPEYSNSAEFGFNVTYFSSLTWINNVEFTFEIFSRTIYNKLLTRPFDDQIAYVQIGRNVTKGFENALKFNELFHRIFITASIIRLNISNPLLYSYRPEENYSINIKFVSPIGFYLTSTYFYEGESLGWYFDTNNELRTEEISPFFDMDLTFGIKLPLKFISADLQFAGYNIFDNSEFKYYYLKKRYLQVSFALRY